MNSSSSPTLKVLRTLFGGVVRSTRGLPHARARQARLHVEKDVAYLPDGGVDHRLDVIRSRTAKGVQPALLYIHGGGFAVCTKETHEILTSTYASMGFTVFSINYRLAPEHPFPASFHDACDALLWVLSHGAEYGADVRRLVVAGESAGANLALCLALAASRRDGSDARAAAVFDAEPTIQALLPACGLLQVTDMARIWRSSPQNALTRNVLKRIQETYLPPTDLPECSLDWADPLLQVERRPLERSLPPTFVLCGTKDLLYGDSERLARALTRLGVENELLSEEGAGHAYHALVWTDASKRAWARQRSFLARWVEGIDVRAASPF